MLRSAGALSEKIIRRTKTKINLLEEDGGLVAPDGMSAGFSL